MFESKDDPETGLSPQVTNGLTPFESGISVPNPADQRVIALDQWTIATKRGPVSRWLAKREIRARQNAQADVIKGVTTIVKRQTDLARAQHDYFRAVQAYSSESAGTRRQQELEQHQNELAHAQIDAQLIDQKVKTRKLLTPPETPYGTHEMQEKELERNLTNLDAEIEGKRADIAETRFRRQVAAYKLEHIDEFVKPKVIRVEVPVREERRRPTIEEVRERKVKRQQVAEEDQVALKLDRLKRAKKIRAELAGLGFDEDECERIAREMLDDLEEGGNDGTTL